MTHYGKPPCGRNPPGGDGRRSRPVLVFDIVRRWLLVSSGRRGIRGRWLEGESDSHKLTSQHRAMISGTVRAAPSWLALKGAACGSAPVCPAQQAIAWTPRCGRSRVAGFRYTPGASPMHAETGMSNSDNARPQRRARLEPDGRNQF